jgi:hypothetical protein
MFGQEVPVDEIAVIDQKATAMQSAAQYRDELFAGNQGSMIKVVGGTLVGLYVIYRFLLK